VPYKILDKVVEKLKRKIIYYQKLFWNNKYWDLKPDLQFWT
jgi:hypothetical protein